MEKGIVISPETKKPPGRWFLEIGVHTSKNSEKSAPKCMEYQLHETSQQNSQLEGERSG